MVKCQVPCSGGYHLCCREKTWVSIDHLTDFTQITEYDVMSTPALMVDGKVMSYGKEQNKAEAKNAHTQKWEANGQGDGDV